MKSRVSKKTATKNCPHCHEQVPTACKSCGCGHLFKRLSTPGAVEVETPSDAVKRRRTERTRRERPHYYSAIEYEPFPRRRRKSSKCASDDGAKKKKPSQSPSLTPTTSTAAAAAATTTTAASSSSNGKLRDKDTDKDQSSSEGRESVNRTPKEEDPFAKITPEKALQYSVILQEINRKFGTQNFVPG